MFQILAALTLVGGSPLPALALKPRNEQLCGTGFFTNFLEYRCTDIGDISDEGQRTGLSESEAGAADSLMSKLKLDLDDGDVPGKVEEGATSATDSKPEKEQ